MRFDRYLDAKASVERGCLDRTVLNEVTEILERTEDPDVLEVGAGTGSMVVHLSESDALPEGTSYTALDKDPDVLERGRERLSEHPLSEPRDSGGLGVDGAEVEFVHRDLYDETGGYDLIIAHAVLDLLPLYSAVEHLLGISEFFYFPVCFDGVTAFEPTYDEELDARIEEVYHRTMDERAGGSETGRRVFGAVEAAGGTVTAAGSSDWVIFPDEDGYTDDERYVLRYIVETVADVVAGRNEVDDGRLRDWLRDRRSRIDEGELVYLTHQIDLAGMSG